MRRVCGDFEEEDDFEEADEGMRRVACGSVEEEEEEEEYEADGMRSVVGAGTGFEAKIEGMCSVGAAGFKAGIRKVVWGDFEEEEGIFKGGFCAVEGAKGMAGAGLMSDAGEGCPDEDETVPLGGP